MNFVTYEKLVSDVHDFTNKHNFINTVGVVGIPRSGMIPASIIATRYNFPLADIHYFLNTGGRFYPSVRGTIGQYANQGITDSSNTVLLVDDTSDSHSTFNIVLAELQNHQSLRYCDYQCITIYTSQEHNTIKHHSILNNPRMFEWNWTRSGNLGECMLDMDGLICEDPLESDKVDEQTYRNWIKNAVPRFIPKSPIRAIVSARLMSFKQETEEWLNRHGIVYRELILLNATAETRSKQNLYAIHKANYYSRSKSKLFIESEPWQAEEIHKLSRKPVLCIPTSGKPIYHRA